MSDPKYSYEQEMENAEPEIPHCCAECDYWGTYALKHGLNRAVVIAEASKHCQGETAEDKALAEWMAGGYEDEQPTC